MLKQVAIESSKHRLSAFFELAAIIKVVLESLFLLFRQIHNFSRTFDFDFLRNFEDLHAFSKNHQNSQKN